MALLTLWSMSVDAAVSQLKSWKKWVMLRWNSARSEVLFMMTVVVVLVL